MYFTYLLAPLGLSNHPLHVLGDCDNPEGRGMPIRSLFKFLNHTNEMLIIPGNMSPYWFRLGSRGPAAAGQ